MVATSTDPYAHLSDRERALNNNMTFVESHFNDIVAYAQQAKDAGEKRVTFTQTTEGTLQVVHSALVNAGFTGLAYFIHDGCNSIEWG
jgi:hypothetical protein